MVISPPPSVPSDGPTEGWLPTGVFWRAGRFYWWNQYGGHWEVWDGEEWLPLAPQPELIA